MEGIILKGVGSFYSILCTGQTYICKARGRFRKDGLSPVPGDHVTFSMESGEEGRIDKIHMRKNLLTRPCVANIDKLIIVMAPAPKPDLFLTDKLLLQCELLSITPIIVVNKCDMPEEQTPMDITADFAHTGYRVLAVSAYSGENMQAVEDELRGCISCFAGQSAVGKSSLLNRLLPELELETGGLSRKTSRGRHTTRVAQLWPAYGGAVLDTPGFSLFDLPEMEPEALPQLYPEMRAVTGECRFAQCQHVKEPECAVKAALEQGKISQSRYARYCLLLEELKEKRKHQYD